MIGRVLSKVVGWVRDRYPAWAPQRGHVALMALYGVDGSRLEQQLRAAS